MSDGRITLATSTLKRWSAALQAAMPLLTEMLEAMTGFRISGLTKQQAERLLDFCEVRGITGCAADFSNADGFVVAHNSSSELVKRFRFTISELSTAAKEMYQALALHQDPSNNGSLKA